MSSHEKNNPVIFYPLDKRFKSVTGAIRKDEKTLFAVELPQEMPASGVNMLVKKADSEKEMLLPLLRYENSASGKRRFEGLLSIEETGTFFYKFLIEKRQEKTISENASEGVKSYGNEYSVEGCGNQDCENKNSADKEKYLYRNVNEIGCGEGGYGEFFSAYAPTWVLNVYEREYSVPHWCSGGIMYHIFVDRFMSVGEVRAKAGVKLRSDWGNMPEYLPDKETGEILNNDFFGGNLRGIESKLDYLQSLGVSVIYLSPVFEAFSNHKYDTGDYEKIDPMFGSNEDFTSLCSNAAMRGMKVILDGVFNHTGSDSRYFNRYGHYNSVGAYQSESSPYADWYCFYDSRRKYDSWWNFETLPKLNSKSQSLRDYIFGEGGVVEKWLSIGASGWRLDVVDELTDEMLDGIVSRAKVTKNDAFIIGEVWEDASTKISYGKRRRYFEGKQLDSVMNYPLKDAIIGFLRSGNAKIMHDVNFMLVNNYPQEVRNCLMNILGTHDTERILTALAGNTHGLDTREKQMRYRLPFEDLLKAKRLLRLAVVLLYTHYGFPCVYYGDEAGVQGCRDPFNRTCFPWNSTDGSLIEFFRLLGRIRRENPVFDGGDFTEIIADGGLYAYERTKGEETLIIAVNAGEEEKIVYLTSPAVDLLTEKLYNDCVTLEKQNAVILKTRKGV